MSSVFEEGSSMYILTVLFLDSFDIKSYLGADIIHNMRVLPWMYECTVRQQDRGTLQTPLNISISSECSTLIQ